MIKIFKGYRKRCSNASFCLFDQSSREISFFKNDEKLAEHIAENHSSDFNDVSSEIHPTESNYLMKIFGFRVREKISTTDLDHIMLKVKNLIY